MGFPAPVSRESSRNIVVSLEAARIALSSSTSSTSSTSSLARRNYYYDDFYTFDDLQKYRITPKNNDSFPLQSLKQLLRKG